MKCRSCKRDIPENSLFCNWCGEKQIREKKKKTELSVPKPTRRASGLWIASLMIEGKRTTVSAPTEAEYYAKARALKAGLITKEDPTPKRTLDSVVTAYITSREQVLSPSTVRPYRNYWKNHFLAYHTRQIGGINFQTMVNDELKLCNPPIVKKAWSLVKSALKEVGMTPDVKTAPVARHERDWLSDEQIIRFIPLIVGEKCELTALLGLHSLRESEIGGLSWEDYDGKSLHIHRSYVRGPDGMVLKDLPKTEAGNRTVTIFIPRLKELLDSVPTEQRTGRIVQSNVRTDSGRIKKICQNAGLGCITNHCLRHSFATLCHRQRVPLLVTKKIGGWADLGTVQKIYTHLDEQDAVNADKTLNDYFTTKLQPISQETQ